MIIEYKAIGNGLNRMREIVKITSEDGSDVDSFGYVFNNIVMERNEILSDRDFNNKIQRIRKCNKISLGKIKGKVNVKKWRRDNP